MENSDTNALESMDNAKNYNNHVYKKILKNLITNGEANSIKKNMS